MSNDENQMADIMRLYSQTAEKLYKGEPVQHDEMCRYQGMTGMLVARISNSLWTKEELNHEIDARIKVLCDDCLLKANSAEPMFFRVARALIPFRWPIAIMVFSPFAPEIIWRVIAVFK